MKKKLKIEARWESFGMSLCHGTWIIKIQGKLIAPLVPDLSVPNILKNPMSTLGVYYDLFDPDDEEYEEYVDGYGYVDWVKIIYKPLLLPLLNAQNIKLSNSNVRKLYKKIQKHDFRMNSCGACI